MTTPDPPDLREALRAASRHVVPDDVREAHRSAIRAAASAAPVVPTTRPVRGRRRLVVGIAVGALLIPGVGVAAQSSLPGDPLYSVKRATERVRVVFDPTVGARHRLDELRRLLEADAPDRGLLVALGRAEQAVEAVDHRALEDELDALADAVDDLLDARARAAERAEDAADDVQDAADDVQDAAEDAADDREDAADDAADDAEDAAEDAEHDRSGPGDGATSDEDRSGPGGGDDPDEDRSGPGGGDEPDETDEDRSGSGGRDEPDEPDDPDEDRSGSNSGPG